jgi:DNA-binding CsgD family transcriptional regulator
VAWADERGIPKALGLDTREWVQNYVGGWVRLPADERVEAVAELTTEGKSQRQIADVLGVAPSTDAADQKRAGVASPRAARNRASTKAKVDGVTALLKIEQRGRQWVEAYVGAWVRLPLVEQRQAVKELAAQGLSQRRIAEVLGVAQSTVHEDLRPEPRPEPEPEPEPIASDQAVPEAEAAPQPETIGSDQAEAEEAEAEETVAEQMAHRPPTTEEEVARLKALWAREMAGLARVIALDPAKCVPLAPGDVSLPGLVEATDPLAVGVHQDKAGEPGRHRLEVHPIVADDGWNWRLSKSAGGRPHVVNTAFAQPTLELAVELAELLRHCLGGDQYLIPPDH